VQVRPDATVPFLMRPPSDVRVLPPAVNAALAASAAAGFALSCSESTGRLLAALAAARPDGLIGEDGTGFGVGTAWLASGLGPAGRIVTVDADAHRSAAARRVHEEDPRERVLTGDWTLLADHAPFDLLFCDGGGKRTTLKRSSS
jgi:predicted O-methyltransferase YrrM